MVKVLSAERTNFQETEVLYSSAMMRITGRVSRNSLKVFPLSILVAENTVLECYKRKATIVHCFYCSFIFNITKIVLAVDAICTRISAIKTGKVTEKCFRKSPSSKVSNWKMRNSVLSK